MTNNTLLQSHHAYLWVGTRQAIIKQAEEHLMRAWCKNDFCQSCTICLGIKERCYYLLHWMLPHKQTYTVAQIQHVVHLLSFSLDPHEHFYIVIEHAELLSLNSAHVLLKSLEEPPPGYHFILLTESLEALLPTIVSRCVIQQVYEPKLEEWSHFLSFFYGQEQLDYRSFDKECERGLPPEYETRKLLESLMAYWLSKYHSLVKDGSDVLYVQAVLRILEEALKVMPMPGSAKLFWRTLFLKIAFQGSR